jgi:hypothetical protein
MTYNRPEDRVSPEEIGGVTPGMLTRLYAIKAEVEKATRDTGLPGWINGPADAFRHGFLAGRLRQEFGYLQAQVLLASNEVKGIVQGWRDPAGTLESTILDNQINQKGLGFAKGISSPTELHDILVEATRNGIENGGVDRPGALHWLPSSKWLDINGDPETRPIPPNWRRGAGWQIDRSRDAVLAAEAMDLPVEAWREAHARAMIADRRYRTDNPERAGRAARVAAFYERGGGAVRVSAYTRADGARIAAHTRSSPRA